MEATPATSPVEDGTPEHEELEAPEEQEELEEQEEFEEPEDGLEDSPELEDEELEGEELEDDDEFEDDEEFDEEELEDDDDLSDEDIEELLNSLDDDDDGQPDVVPHAALHKERERRKEVQQNLSQIDGQLSEANELVGKYEASLESVKAQLKELDLLDVVKLDEPKRLDPEVLQVRQAQAQQEQQNMIMKSVSDIRDEAAGFVDEYPLIDGDDAGVAEIVVGLSLANMAFGMEQEESVHHAMQLLNGSLSKGYKSSVRKARPAPRRSAKASVRKRQAPSVKVEKGNVSGFFKQMADDRF